MSEALTMVGNGDLTGRVCKSGVLEDVYFPSGGLQRYLLRSQFGLYLERRRQLDWLAEGCIRSQQYLDDTSIVESRFAHPDELEVCLLDFVPALHDVFVRTLEVRNLRSYPRRVTVVHAEAASLEDGAGDFGVNAAYVNRQLRVLRYRRLPLNRGHGSRRCVVIHGSPQPDEYQVGRSFARFGPDLDSFHDALDGSLQGNDLCNGSEEGSTSAFLWRLELAPGASARISVLFSGGSSTHEAEARLEAALGTPADSLARETVRPRTEWSQRTAAVSPAEHPEPLRKRA